MKPRQWTIAVDKDGVLWGNQSHLVTKTSNCFPCNVIEKSAFDELRAENEKLKQEIKDVYTDEHNRAECFRRGCEKLRADNDRLQKILDTSVVLPGKPSKEIAELRAENEELKTYGSKPCPVCGDYFEENDKLRADNAALVEALKDCIFWLPQSAARHQAEQAVIKYARTVDAEALAKHGGTGLRGET